LVQVRDFVTVRNTVQLRKLLKVLGTDFALSQNAHMRKGGLIGLAAMAIGLGSFRFLIVLQIRDVFP
jgi:vacuole morphology and inheritance protein 14